VNIRQRDGTTLIQSETFGAGNERIVLTYDAS
jgi:hypothetical protein